MSWLDIGTTLVGTFVGAWAGGWAAFRGERRTRERVERNSRISAANKALFTIATMYNSLDNLRQFYIEAHRNDPNRALTMNSPQPGMMQALHFDFDSINYFLDQEGEACSMALMELQVLDWHYQIVVNTAELRAKAGDELHQAIRANPIANPNLETIKAVYAAEYGRLAALTDQLIEVVDEGIAMTRQANDKMQKALQLQFPEQSLLQIKFAVA